jgi:hypothetical protein
MMDKLYFKDIGRVNYLGQRMLQRVNRCMSVPIVEVYNSKAKG